LQVILYFIIMSKNQVQVLNACDPTHRMNE